MSANDKQVGGDHYKTKGLQHWDMIDDYDVPYLEGQASKYVFRWRKKNGTQDLEKGLHFVEKRLEICKVSKEASIRYGGVPMLEALHFCEDENVPREDAEIFAVILSWKSVSELEDVVADIKNLIKANATT